MTKEGKYIYCIIRSDTERSFGSIGIGGRGDEVTVVTSGDLCMVMSDSPLTKYVVSRENLLAHERVIEEVMKEYTVLPVRFCTIAPSRDKIRNLLDRRQKEFRSLLTSIDGSVELGVKALWRDISMVFKELAEEDRVVAELKRRLHGGTKDIERTIEVGKAVEKALQAKKQRESEAIVSQLKRAAIDYKANRTVGEQMFLNTAFLVHKGRQMEFDNLIEDLIGTYKERTKFMYFGPIAPYNFISVNIHPEEWEK